MNQHIRSTFLAAFLAVSVAAVSGFGANPAQAELSAEALDGLAVVSEGLDKIKEAQDAHIIAPNDQVMLDHERQIKESREEIEAALAVVASAAGTDDEKANVAAMAKAFDELFEHSEHILELSRSNNDDEARAEATKVFDPVFEKIQELRVELLIG